MTTSGRLESSGRGTRRAGLICATVTVALAFVARGAVADYLTPDEEVVAAEGHLGTKSERQAEAIALFANGLFEEESEGPEKALESFRKVLNLDPGYSELAIKVAYDYLRRGDTAEATSVLKDAIKASPKDYAAPLALSTIYLRHLQKPDLAIKYAQAALAAAPNAFAPYETLWDIYESQGQSAKAAAMLEKAIKSKSTDPAFWLSLAQLYARSVNSPDAPPSPEDLAKLGTLTDKVREFGDNEPEMLGQAGDLMIVAGQLERAAGYYQRALELNPELPSAREKLAGCYIQSGKTAEAAAVLEQIVKDNPLDVSAYEQLSKLHLKNGNLKKAAAAAEQALIIEPYSARRYFDVVGPLMDLQEFDRAAAHLAEARKRFPQAPQFTMWHAVALSGAKKHEEAMRAFEEALVEAGNNQPELLNADFYFRYGAAAEQGGHYVKAAELFKKSIELEPATAGRAYNYLGYMWVERNENLAEAEQLIRRALELEPGNGAYVDSLGWLLYKQGKYEDALGQLLKASESLPEPDPVVFDHIGDAYSKLGRNAEAVLYWQKALQLSPQDQKIVGKLDEAAKKVAQKPKSAEVKPQTPAN